jgi:tetratricopeptide (TPR) repeat protein
MMGLCPRLCSVCRPWLWSCFVFCFCPFVFPGVVTLNSGEKISGRIIEKTDEHIKILANGTTRTFDRGRVASIAGNKPQFTTFDDNEITIERGLLLASQGAFLHAEAVFKKLILRKTESDLPLKALEIINDYRNGAITHGYALSLFKGALHFYHRDFQQAIDVYEKSLELNPQALEIYYNLANAYLITGDAQSAVHYLEKLAAVKPNDLEIIFSLAVSYQTLGIHEKAVVHFKKLISFSPHDPEIHSLLASSYLALGKAEAGRKTFLKAKEMFQERGQVERAEKIETLLGNLP